MSEIPYIIVSYMCREALLNYLQEHCPSTHAEKLYRLVHLREYDGTILFRQKLCSLLLEFSVVCVNDLTGEFHKQLLKEVEELCRLLGRRYVNLQKVVCEHLESNKFPENKLINIVIGVCDDLLMMYQISTIFGPHGTAVLLTSSKVARRPLAIKLRKEQKKDKKLCKIINFNGYIVLGTVADFMITEYVKLAKGCSILSLEKNLSSRSEFDLFVGKGVHNVCFLCFAHDGNSQNVFIVNTTTKKILDRLLQNRKVIKSFINVSALPIQDSYLLHQDEANNIRFISKSRLSRSGILRIKPHSLFISSGAGGKIPLEILVAIFSSRLFMWYYNLYRAHEDDGKERNVWVNAMMSFPCPEQAAISSRLNVISRIVNALEWMDAMPFSVHTEFPLPSHIYKMQEVLDMMVYELYFASEMQQSDLLISLYLKEFVDRHTSQGVELFTYEFIQWYDQFGNPVRDRISLLPIRSRDLLNIFHSIR